MGSSSFLVVFQRVVKFLGLAVISRSSPRSMCHWRPFGRGRLAFQPFVPSGHLVVSPLGCLTVWPFGRLGAWQLGRLAVWPLGRLANDDCHAVALSSESRSFERSLQDRLTRKGTDPRTGLLNVKRLMACLLLWVARFPSLSGPGSCLCSCVVCGSSLGVFGRRAENRSVPLVFDEAAVLARRNFGQVSLYFGVV